MLIFPVPTFPISTVVEGTTSSPRAPFDSILANGWSVSAELGLGEGEEEADGSDEDGCCELHVRGAGSGRDCLRVVKKFDFAVGICPS